MGEEGLVRAQSDKQANVGRGVRSPDPTLWQSLGSLGECPQHAKRQRTGVDGTRPP